MSNTTKNNGMKLNICLSDIPEDKIKIGKNEKKYIDINVFQRSTPDEFGNEYTLVIPKSKEETEAETETIYVGNGRKFKNPSK